MQNQLWIKLSIISDRYCSNRLSPNKMWSERSDYGSNSWTIS